MNKIVFFIIVFVAFILRFYQLGSNPPSLDWDEASLGYNAYSILKTGADEYGNNWPIAFRSFDDFKPPAYVYLTVPSVAVFGLTEFAVRLPSALFGVMAVILMYFLAKELFKASNLKLEIGSASWRRNIPEVAALLLAISPWHLQFSRVAFEANVGLTFFIGGVLFLIGGIEKKKFLPLSMVFFVLSLYSYHSLRLVVPLFLLGFFIYKRFALWQAKKYVAIGLVIAFILGLPLILSFIGTGGGVSRFSSVTTIQPTGTLDHSITQLQYDQNRNDVFGSLIHNRRIVYGLTILKGYLDHWNFVFLFLEGDGISRHHAINMGMLYVFELPFVLLGIYSLVRSPGIGRGIVFLWFLVAPIASAITSGTPHPVRALLMVVPLHIFTALGVIFTLPKVSSIKYQVLSIKLRYLIFSLCILFFLFNILYYIHQYYVHTPIESSQGWQYGYKQVFEELAKIEDKYDKIIVTYKYDQPYIFHLFYHKIDPAWYQKQWDYFGDRTIERARRIYGKYEFRNINWGEDQKAVNTLIIGTEDEFPKDLESLKVIHFLDGRVAFRFVEP